MKYNDMLQFKRDLAGKLDQKRLRAFKRKVLLSGDVELNPGPVGNENCRTVKEGLCSAIG